MRVRAYVRRHCAEADCDDVLSEVYLVAWRRFAELPEDPLPWLLGTARKVLANHWRSRDRRDRLTAELQGIDHLAVEPDAADRAIDRTAMLEAVAALGPDDRELLLLVGWDGLNTAGVAAVLGCSAGAARMRLNRARQRLEEQLAEAGAPPFLRRTPAEEGN